MSVTYSYVSQSSLALLCKTKTIRLCSGLISHCMSPSLGGALSFTEHGL